MKGKYFVIVLLSVAVCLGGCKKKEQEPEAPKSKACDVISFKTGDTSWQVSGLNITAIFPKATAVNNLIPAIEVSGGATVSPKSGVAQDFSEGKPVTYTVTAEDQKTTKIYTAKATVTSGD